MRKWFSIELDGETLGVEAIVTTAAYAGGNDIEVDIVGVDGWIIEDFSDSELDDIRQQIIEALAEEGNEP